MNKKLKKHGSILFSVFVIAFTIFLTACHDKEDAKSPLIGQTLLKTKTELLEQTNRLDKKIESLNQDISRRQGLRQSLPLLSEMINRLLNGLFSKAILIAGIWTFLLVLMYKKINRDEYQKHRGLILKLLLSFYAIGFLCVLTGIASANDSSALQVPKFDLPQTLQRADQLDAMALWERVRDALEETNCTVITIPPEIIAWISQNCPDAQILNPIEGQGPHRLAALAAIYWSSGDKKESLELLKPLEKEAFRSASLSSRSAFTTAVCLFANNRDIETTGKLARKMMPSLDVAELLWLAGKIRQCNLSVANECLDKAAKKASTVNEVILVSKAFREFTRVEDANAFITRNIGLAKTFDDLKTFLEYTRNEGLSDIEQRIISWNIDQRQKPGHLIKLATFLKETGYEAPARMALEKAIEKEWKSDGLAEIAAVALEWNMLVTAQTSLIKIIDIDGLRGAAREFPDPMLVPASRDKPLDQNPSTGIVVGLIAEKLGDHEKARTYYTDALNAEVYNKIVCLGSARDIHFINFFYPYRFFVSQSNTALVNLLEPVGRELEEALVANLKGQMNLQIKARQDQINALKKKIRHLKLQNFLGNTSRTLFAIYVLMFLTVFIMAQIVAFRMMLDWVHRLDHFKTFGGFIKLIELEGFIALASVVAAPLGLILIILSQFSQSLLLAEAHTFRICELFRTTAQENTWPKLPPTYRD